MWKPLPMQGNAILEVRIEGTDVIVVPKAGERLRVPTVGEITIETVGRVVVRTSSLANAKMRVSFSGDLVLERGEVAFDGTEAAWQLLWRRARTQSLPWWNQADGPELELDHAMQARFVIQGAALKGRA